MEIAEIIKDLQQKRTVFHSESDFQFALAWVIKERYKDAKIYLEIPVKVDSQKLYIDIVVELDRKLYPIELKYKTKSFNKKISDEFGESYSLKKHSAQTQGRYDYLKDIYRLERILKVDEKYEKGYAVFLTNDKSYCEESPKEDTVDKAFQIYGGREISGLLEWSEEASEGTKKGRDNFELSGKYKIDWKNYSQIENCTFEYCINVVEKVEK
jgi:hypothetical protein